MKGYLLTLPERKGKSKSIVDAAHALKIDIEIIDAVDARKPDTLQKILDACPIHTRFHLGLPRVMHCIIGKPGALGCYMSHMKAWRSIAQMKEPAFVFEDDVNLDKKQTSVVNQMYKLCQDGLFDCIQSTFHIKPLFRDESILRIITPLMGAQSYCLSPKGAQMLLEHLSSMDSHVDFALGMLANVTVHDKEPFRLGLAQPGIDKQTKEESLIQHDNEQSRYLDSDDYMKIFGDYYADPERYQQKDGKTVREGQSPNETNMQMQPTPLGTRFQSLAERLPALSRRAFWFNSTLVLILMLVIILLSLIAIVSLSVALVQAKKK